MATTQLPLPFPASDRRTRADFIVHGGNAAALHLVTHAAQWPHPVAVIVGPKGAGKSHLGQIFIDETGATLRAMADIRLETLGELMPKPLVIEDGQTPPDAEALFHLFNRAERTLILSETPPASWAVNLPDLASRLSAVTVVDLPPPSDAVLEPLLLKLFHDRHATPDAALIRYLLPRIERSYDAARTIADRLTTHALSTGRALNTALAREVLEAETGDLWHADDV